MHIENRTSNQENKMRRITLMSWSSGKDSAWALYKLQQDPQIEIDGLFCTVNSEYHRVAMHAIRVELLQRQVESVGLPMKIIEIPYPCTNEEYEEIMAQFVESAKATNIEYSCLAIYSLRMCAATGKKN